MALNKITYVDHVTVIPASNLNEIQDCIEANETASTSAKNDLVEGSGVDYTTSSGYITYNGQIAEAGENGELYTSLIPVFYGMEFYFALRHPQSRQNWCAYALYDESENFISRITPVELVPGTEASYKVQITDAKVKYIRFTWRSYSTGEEVILISIENTVNEINEKIVGIESQEINLLEDATWVNGVFDANGSVIVNGESTRIATPNMIDLIKYESVTIKGSEQYMVAYHLFGSNQAHILDSGWLTMPTTIDLKSTPAQYIRFGLRTVGSTAISPTDGATIKAEGISTESYGENLVDNSKLIFGYVNSIGDIAQPSLANNEKHTAFIPVVAGDKITIDTWVTTTSTIGAYSWLSYVWFDENKNFLTYWSQMGSTYGEIHTKKYAVVPSNAKYMVVQFRAFEDGIMSVRHGYYTYDDKPNYVRGNTINEFSRLPLKSVNHMGYNSVAPANTLPAFKLSKQNGFDIVETDLQYSSDNVPVCCHDAVIDNYSDGTGTIRNMTYNQLLQYDFGSWKSAEYAGTKICALSELMSLCRNTGMFAYLELKGDSGFTQELAQIVYGIINQYDMLDRVTFISFNSLYLAWMLELYPKFRVGFLFNDNSYSVANVNRVIQLQTNENEAFFEIRYNSTVISNYIEYCKEKNIPVEVYTPTTENELIALDNYISGATCDSLNFATVMENYALS